MEDKELFVKRIGDALIECGDGRYDDLRENPLEYKIINDREYVESGIGLVCVNLDSLPAMMRDIARLFL